MTGANVCVCASASVLHTRRLYVCEGSKTPARGARARPGGSARVGARQGTRNLDVYGVQVVGGHMHAALGAPPVTAL